MAKAKTVFFCTNCGNETPKWMGRCPGCGAFNTMEEHIEKPVPSGKAKAAPVGISRRPQRIREVTSDSEIRFSTGIIPIPARSGPVLSDSPDCLQHSDCGTADRKSGSLCARSSA